MDSPTTSFGSGGPTHTAGADQKRITGTLAMNASYVTGGDAIAPLTVGLGHIDDLWIADTTQFGVTLQYQSGGTIKMFATGTIITSGAAVDTALEMATGTNGSTVIARFFAWGT